MLLENSLRKFDLLLLVIQDAHKLPTESEIITETPMHANFGSRRGASCVAMCLPETEGGHTLTGEQRTTIHSKCIP